MKGDDDMNFFEFLAALVFAVASGAAGAAVINGLNERWKFRASRKAAKEDRAEEKADRTDEISQELEKFKESEGKKNEELEKRLNDIVNQLAAVAKAERVILLDRILHLGKGYIDKGEISFDDRKRFHDMHSCYHDDLGGNGDAKLVVEGVDELPLKH